MRGFDRAAVLLAGAITMGAATAASAAVPAGTAIDGIRCDTMEGSVQHIHQHLAIRDHGKPLAIPADLGRPLAGQCLYWIHTHTPDGIIHIESPQYRAFTLGELFDVWGEPLSRTNVAGAKPKRGEKIVVWVDGHKYAGNPRTLELTNHLDVTIDVGPPYATPRPFTDWNGN